MATDADEQALPGLPDVTLGKGAKGRVIRHARFAVVLTAALGLALPGSVQAVVRSDELFRGICGYSASGEPLYYTTSVSWTQPSDNARDNWYVGEGTTGDGDYAREELATALNQSLVVQTVTLDNSACLSAARLSFSYRRGQESGRITYGVPGGSTRTVTRSEILADTGGYTLLTSIGVSGAN